ncbi:MAG: hypothetical protein KF715_03815 [Candidatus Didemnitutus sp.]|nr:hypothetical protein [Candidatus Didemnitutus sp.]
MITTTQRIRRHTSLCLFPLLLLLSGCVTAKKYRLSGADAPPAVAVDWRAEQGGVTVQIQNVITFKGPGSWKQEARWDEYAVRLGNTSAAPVTITSVELVDLHGRPQQPSTDPWVLEKASYTNWEKYGKTGLKLSAGAGAVILYTSAATAAASGSILSGGAAAGGSVAAMNILPAVALVDITAVAVMNRNNRKAVETEFARRRIELPLTLAPQQQKQGSFFFPMTPAPKELIVHARVGNQEIELRLPLPALAKLHLKPDEKMSH